MQDNLRVCTAETALPDPSIQRKCRGLGKPEAVTNSSSSAPSSDPPSPEPGPRQKEGGTSLCPVTSPREVIPGLLCSIPNLDLPHIQAFLHSKSLNIPLNLLPPCSGTFHSCPFLKRCKAYYSQREKQNKTKLVSKYRSKGLER